MSNDNMPQNFDSATRSHADRLQWYEDQGGIDEKRLAGVLELHYPELRRNTGGDLVVCAECGKQWQCPTYKVIRWGP